MPLSIRLPADLERRLDELASRTGRTKTYYVRQAVLEKLQDLEDYYLAAERAAAVRAGRMKTVALDQVLAKHAVARRTRRAR